MPYAKYGFNWSHFMKEAPEIWSFFLSLYSLNGQMSYREISWSLETAIFGFSRATETLVKFQSDTVIITSNLAALGLHEIWR